MSSPVTAPRGLRPCESVVVDGLTCFESRVDNPRASVICVHGALDRGGSFARVARRLDDLDVVTYDRRGYQGSRALAPVDLEHHVEDLRRLADVEAERGPVIVFGHSYGGVVALGAAITENPAVRGVLVYETSLPWVHSRPGFSSYVAGEPGHEAEMFFRRVVSNGSWERLTDHEKQDRREDGPALVNDMVTLRGEPPFDVRELRVPLAFAHGDSAPGEYYAEVARHLIDLVPAVTSEQLQNCGHGAHLSRPDHVANFIRSHLP